MVCQQGQETCSRSTEAGQLMSTPTPDTLIRIEAARALVRRAIASDTLALIHPFDLATLLKNPMTIDAVIINLDNRQYIVIDGTVYRCTSDVKNQTKLNEMMAQ